jgi:hypothetical protein
MNRSKLNFIIEALMFLLVMGQVGTGLSLWREMHIVGDLHFYLGLIMVALVFAHIYLHWNIVVKMYQKMIVSSVKRKIIAVLYILISLMLLAWFVIRTGI